MLLGQNNKGKGAASTRIIRSPKIPPLWHSAPPPPPAYFYFLSYFFQCWQEGGRGVLGVMSIFFWKGRKKHTATWIFGTWKGPDNFSPPPPQTIFLIPRQHYIIFDIGSHTLFIKQWALYGFVYYCWFIWYIMGGERGITSFTHCYTGKLMWLIWAWVVNYIPPIYWMCVCHINFLSRCYIVFDPGFIWPIYLNWNRRGRGEFMTPKQINNLKYPASRHPSGVQGIKMGRQVPVGGKFHIFIKKEGYQSVLCCH